jgi:hypothetical protein
VLFLVCSSKPALAQWQADVRLTNDQAESMTAFNNSWTLAADGNYLHIVWTDYRNNEIEIYYKRSTDGGISWGADTRLTNSQGSKTPSVAVSGSIVYVVWEDDNAELYYKRSVNQGESWGADVRLTESQGGSRNPSISVSSQNIHVTWEDNRDTGLFGYPEIYYKRSTDGGISWGADTRLTVDPAESNYPSVSASGNFVHVSFEDNRENWDLYYKRSTDGGASWHPEVRLTESPSISVSHSIASSGSMVHIAGLDNASGFNEIHYIRSTDGGISWEADTILTNNSFTSDFPSICVSESAVHIIWQELYAGNWEIFYKRSINGGASWEPEANITNHSSASHYPFISASGMNIHTVWSDNRDGNYEIYYKRNPTGNVIGISGNNTATADKFILEQNYPNHFNPLTVINYSVPDPAYVTIKVYDLLGREVTAMVSSHHKTGNHTGTFDGSGFPSGIYFYVMTAGGFKETRKMILLK